MINLTALATELAADPAGLGYAPLLAAGQDNAVADLLNAVDATITLYDDVPAHLVAAAVDPLEFGARSAAERAWLQFIVSPAVVALSNAALRTALGNVFPAGSATRAALQMLSKRDGSRAEALFGAGAVVDASHIAKTQGRG